MDRTQGILSAVRHACRGRLIRFVRYMDPGMPAWKGNVEDWSDAMLRDAAFCAADRFYAVRRVRREVRAIARLPHRIPAGHTVIPSYSGPALDVWCKNNPPDLSRSLTDWRDFKMTSSSSKTEQIDEDALIDF